MFKQWLMPKNSRQITGRILIVLFAFYYVSICFFYHSHILNGVTIVHSHIHSKAHAQTGTHSDSELNLISTLSSFLSLKAGASFVELEVFLLLQCFILPFFERKLILRPVACLSLRAPPALFRLY
jgi:hypothetical protein